MALTAENYPTLFAQLGTPLYQSAEQLQPLIEVNALSKPVQDYSTASTKVKAYGFKVEKSSHKEEKKHYLQQLRKLQKEHDTLVIFLQKKLSKTIVNDDYKLFSSMVSSDATLFFQKRKLKEQVYAYYHKKHREGTIPSLQKRIKKDKKIIEVYSPVTQSYSNYANHSKKRQQQATQKSIIVLSTPTCPYCKKAKRYLHSKGVAFRDYNINSSSEGKRLYQKYNGSGVPLVIINGKVIRGYSEAQMRAALR